MTCVCCKGKKPVVARGLCQTCYDEFSYKKRQLSPQDRKIFDKAAVDEGRILPSSQGKRPGKPGAFDDLFNRLFRNGEAACARPS
jgi:hypothetical protein